MSELELNPDEIESSRILPGIAPLEDLETAHTEKPLSPPRPWGPWATIGWTLLCITAMFVAQIFALVIFVACRFVSTANVKFDDLAMNGNVIALATLLSTSAAIGLIALLVYIRRYPIRDYLVLYWPSARSVLISLAGLAVLLGATDLSSYLLGRPLVPTVMVEIYRASWLPTLLAALVVLAPIGEETVFRGFSLYSLESPPRGQARSWRFSSARSPLPFCICNMIGLESSPSLRPGFTWAWSAINLSRCF